jgi:hypothetical protein
MIQTRGCASRLLVLSTNGNLRALLSGLIFAVTAQAALAGALSPWRETISGWWTVDGGRSRSGWGFWKWIGGIGTGLMVAAGWGFSCLVSINSFQVFPVQGLTFSGPSAEWLMRVLAAPAPEIGFNFGLILGVFLGSFVGAWVGKDFKLEGFSDGYGMRRYIVGAHSYGFWLDVGQRMCGWGGHFRWINFRLDRLAVTGRHVDGFRLD